MFVPVGGCTRRQAQQEVVYEDGDSEDWDCGTYYESGKWHINRSTRRASWSKFVSLLDCSASDGEDNEDVAYRIDNSNYARVQMVVDEQERMCNGGQEEQEAECTCFAITRSIHAPLADCLYFNSNGHHILGRAFEWAERGHRRAARGALGRADGQRGDTYPS